MQKTPSFFTKRNCACNRIATLGISVFEDPILGDYTITNEAREYLDEQAHARNKVACVLAERHLRFGQERVFVTRNSSRRIAAGFEGWTTMSVDELLGLYPRTASELLDRCLVNLSYQISHPSEYVEITEDSAWLLYSAPPHSQGYVLGLLCEAGYLKHEGYPARGGKSAPNIENYSFKVRGWERLAELTNRDVARSNQAFVAMWFDESTSVFFDQGIRPAISESGTTPIRVDKREHNNKICDEIIAEIRKSKFVVADFTGHRGGVYFEAGYAQGLGIPVIWTVHADHLKDLHFDTRQYNHIVYSSPEDLKQKLSARIGATI